MKKLILSSLLMVGLLVGTTSYATDTATSSSDIKSSDTLQSSSPQTTDTSSNSDVDELATVKSDISLKITDMINQGKLSQFQYEDLKTRIDKATTIDEVELVYSDANKLVKNNQDLYKGTFDEKVSNTKWQLKLLVDSGRLSQQQADDFIARIDKSTTIDELDTIWGDIQAAAKPISSSSSTTESTTDSSQTSDSTKETTKAKDEKDLPKTGETKTNIVLSLTGLGSIILAFTLLKKNKVG